MRKPQSREYRCWIDMRRRCANPGDASWLAYGGRGIAVCERWESFANFLADMGPRPERGFSIERRDNDGNYTPVNCYWATPKQQAANRRMPNYGQRWRTFRERKNRLVRQTIELGFSPSAMRRLAWWKLSELIWKAGYG